MNYAVAINELRGLTYAYYDRGCLPCNTITACLAPCWLSEGPIDATLCIGYYARMNQDS